MARIIAPESLLRHVGWMRALARSLLRDDGLAEDAVQETFLAAVRRPPLQEAVAGAWLRTALCRFASRLRSQEKQRHRRETRAARPESYSDEPDQLLKRVEVHRQLVDEILRLADPYRSTVLLRFFEGLGLAEIARRHGVDESTVRPTRSSGPM